MLFLLCTGCGCQGWAYHTSRRIKGHTPNVREQQRSGAGTVDKNQAAAESAWRRTYAAQERTWTEGNVSHIRKKAC